MSSKQGITIFAEGGWDSVKMQKILDDDLNFIVEHVRKPSELKIFIVLGAYGVYYSYRRRKSNIFISVAYDYFSNTDILYDESIGRDGLILFNSQYKNQLNRNWYPNDMYPGDFPIVLPYLKGQSGLKIYYQNISDTVNYYNHLLSIIDFAIKNIDKIKNEQRRICFPAEMKDWEISILTYDTGKLKAITIRDWGFDVNPQKRVFKKETAMVSFFLIGFVFISLFMSKRIKKGSCTT